MAWASFAWRVITASSSASSADARDGASTVALATASMREGDWCKAVSTSRRSSSGRLSISTNELSSACAAASAASASAAASSASASDAAAAAATAFAFSSTERGPPSAAARRPAAGRDGRGGGSRQKMLSTFFKVTWRTPA